MQHLPAALALQMQMIVTTFPADELIGAFSCSSVGESFDTSIPDKLGYDPIYRALAVTVTEQTLAYFFERKRNVGIRRHKLQYTLSFSCSIPHKISIKNENYSQNTNT